MASAPEITCPQIREKITENKLIAIFFGDQFSWEYKKIFEELLQYQSLSKKFAFFHLNDNNCAKYFGINYQPKIVLFNSQTQSQPKPIIYEGLWELNPLISFMNENSVPTVIDFAEDHIELIFSDQKPSIILFRSQSQRDFSFNKVFSDLSHQYKDEMFFVVADATQSGI